MGNRNVRYEFHFARFDGAMERISIYDALWSNRCDSLIILVTSTRVWIYLHCQAIIYIPIIIYIKAK